MLYLQHTKKRKFMKQSLLSFLFAIVSILTFGTTLNAAETTVTFTPSDFKDGENQELNLTKDGVTLAVSLANIASNQIRVIKSQTLTVSSSTTITKIEFTCTANDAAKYGPGCFTLEESTGSYTYSGKMGTWEGSLNKVVFKASTYQVRATEIVVTLNSDAEASTLKAAGLSWSKSSYNVEAGSEFTSPTFTKETTAAVTFTSDNKSVATVNADGVISLAGGVGTATITASSEKNDTYDAGTASVSITTYAVETYSLASKVASGKKYILVANVDGAYYYAVTVAQGSSYGYLYKDEATVDGDDLKAITGNEITVTGEDGAYTLTDALGRKIWMDSSHNSFQLGGTNSDGLGETWSIAFAADGTVTITNVDRQKYIQYSTKYSSYGSYNTESGVLPYLYEVKSETAIKDVKKADEATDGAKYNILGQKVGENYNGLVISNGKLQVVK